jgi:hypothetical protein
MKFFYVNEKYVDFLRKHDKNVMWLKHPRYKNEKFVIGVVFKFNDINYYAPISSIKDHQISVDEYSLTDFYSGLSFPIILNNHGKDEIVASIKFNYMFPVHHKDFRGVYTKDFDNITYKYYVDNQYSYCLKFQEAIKQQAANVYNKATTNFEEYDKYCLKYKLLEDKYAEWLLHHQKSNPFIIPGKARM